MRAQRVVPQICCIVIVCTLVVGLILPGCGGGGPSGTGCAQGYAYQPIGGGTAIISASSTPPTGYEPVPEGTVVRIDGYGQLETTTDEDGYYLICDIPPGLQTLVVEAPGGTIEVDIPIIANHITDGSGHSEGGG
jgi:hypothetical protein